MHLLYPHRSSLSVNLSSWEHDRSVLELCTGMWRGSTSLMCSVSPAGGCAADPEAPSTATGHAVSPEGSHHPPAHAR